MEGKNQVVISGRIALKLDVALKYLKNAKKGHNLPDSKLLFSFQDNLIKNTIFKKIHILYVDIYFHVTFSFVAFYTISPKCLTFSQYQKKCKIVVGHQDIPTQLHLLPDKIQLRANSKLLSLFMLQLTIQKATL